MKFADLFRLDANSGRLFQVSTRRWGLVAGKFPAPWWRKNGKLDNIVAGWGWRWQLHK